LHLFLARCTFDGGLKVFSLLVGSQAEAQVLLFFPFFSRFREGWYSFLLVAITIFEGVLPTSG